MKYRKHPHKTKRALKQRQIRDFCNDCERYKAFCTGRRIWFDDDDYWVCEACIDAGRPNRNDPGKQQSILSFNNMGDA